MYRDSLAYCISLKSFQGENLFQGPIYTTSIVGLLLYACAHTYVAADPYHAAKFRGQCLLG